MTPDDNLDELLRDRFAGVRDADARRAPAFGEMVARVRAAIPAEPEAPVSFTVPTIPSAAPQASTRRRSPWRWMFAAAPLAVAAGLATIWLSPSRAADREFERLVSEWSRTERALNSPTDGLLAVPGSEYLRRLPRPRFRGGGHPETLVMPLSLPRRRALVFAVALLAAATAPAAAQSAPSIDDPIARTLFEPELIMKHRRAINLTDEQRDAISRLIKELQGQVVSLQWELQDQVESLASELGRSRVDLDRARDRLERVMQTERKIKEGHLTLLVRIKNLLSPQQQAALSRLRAEPQMKEGAEG